MIHTSATIQTEHFSLHGMHFHEDIIQLAKENNYFRKVVASGEYSQIVLMSVAGGEDIGEETHRVDQVIFFVDGVGKAVIDDQEYEVVPNDLVMIRAGMKHNFINTHAHEPLKLFTVYAPPEHDDGEEYLTKADAMAAEE